MGFGSTRLLSGVETWGSHRVGKPGEEQFSEWDFSVESEVEEVLPKRLRHVGVRPTMTTKHDRLDGDTGN